MVPANFQLQRITRTIYRDPGTARKHENSEKSKTCPFGLKFFRDIKHSIDMECPKFQLKKMTRTIENGHFWPFFAPEAHDGTTYGILAMFCTRSS